jgi:class 3 adenylate cyclase
VFAFKPRSLFQKYFLILFVAAGVPLLLSGLSDAWFSYRDQRTLLNSLLGNEAKTGASRIEGFLTGVKGELEWAVQQPWIGGSDEQHRLDALRVLRQSPAIVAITLVDGEGAERLYVSRLDLNRAEAKLDRSSDPAVIGALSRGNWFGPVTFSHDSEPFMIVSVAGNRRVTGAALADVNLKFIREVVSRIHIGSSGHAFVADASGRLIAHPDISKVLRGADEETARGLRQLRDAIAAAGGEAIAIRNAESESVVATMASIPIVDWTLFLEQPAAEVFAPIYVAAWRTAGLLLIATAFSVSLAYWFASRMTKPIRLIKEGAERIGSGQFDHRIDIATDDELESLGSQFNKMALDLSASLERSERIARLKRFLAPQVAELLEKGGDESVLAGQRAEVVVVFCDLRGFTAFSAHAEPETIMFVLRNYYERLGSIITRFEATLTNFSADGLMVLINAPVPCPEPAIRAVEMAIEMERAIQELVTDWRKRGYEIGFGMGLAMGWATVGRIGYEGRIDYTAIGNVVNLAARLCSAAEDRQILVDQAMTHAIRDKFLVTSLGNRWLKGFDNEVPVHAVGSDACS